MCYHQAAALCLAIAALTGTSGCKSMTPKENKSRAEGRWNRIRADFKVQLARQHYEAKLFGESERAASEALAFDPSLTAAYVLLAKSHLELGKPTSAQRAIETARRAGLDTPDLTYMQGVVNETQGDLPVAAAYYADACETSPDNVDYVIAYAESVVAMDRPDLAMQRLDSLIGSYDDNGSVLLLSAHIASLMGETDGAIRRYRLALDALGESRMASRELGLLLVTAGRYEEAIETLTTVMDEAPDGSDDEVARHALATANLRAGRPMRAMSWLMPESLNESKTAYGYIILAEAALSTNDIAVAVAATTTAVRMSPNDPGLALLHATALWRHRDYNAAKRCLKLHIERYRDDATAHCLLAEVLRSQGATDEARDHFRIASELSDDSAWAARGLEALEGVSSSNPSVDAPDTPAPGTPTAGTPTAASTVAPSMIR